MALMRNVLVIGAAGQIGSELVAHLRKDPDCKTVVAGCTGRTPLPESIRETGPSAVVDVTDAKTIAKAVQTYRIDTIYNLAALLSAVGETKPLSAWNVGVNGIINVLEVARAFNCAVFTPSSIGVFGPETPHVQTPQDTVCRPTTMYGITKVTGELLSDYYFKKYDVDTRSVRYPGLISYVTPPGGGTTDYAVEIFYAAVKREKYVCPIAAGTFMDMAYMDDAIDGAIALMRADPAKLVHRNAFNVTAMSFDPEMLYAAIRRRMPDFEMVYDVDPLRQGIAESWPDSMDDSAAREEWGWNPKFGLEEMVDVMIRKLTKKLLG